MKTSILMDKEDILLVNTPLALIVGLNESIFLQQVHYWIGKNKDKKRNFHDGRYWCYNTYEDWKDNNFPFWSIDSIRYAVNKLKKLGVLLVGNYNKLKLDKTLWYSIDYERLDSICDLGKSPHGDSKSPTPIPETTSENNLKSSKSKSTIKATSHKWKVKSVYYEHPEIGVKKEIVEFENGSKKVIEKELVENPTFNKEFVEVDLEDRLAQLRSMGFDVDIQSGEIVNNHPSNNKDSDQHSIEVDDSQSGCVDEGWDGNRSIKYHSER
jgi:hypothetical protein